LESNPVFTLEKASKSFGNNFALQGLSLTIHHGERVAIIGPSGAGKTTLFRLLCGVLHPDSGTVNLFNHDTKTLGTSTLRRLRKEVGVLYQSDNLIPQLRVVHNVLMGNLGRWALPKALWSLLWPQELSCAREALRQVELEEKLWAMPTELSGGQQQRVALARLLVQRPKVVLADEPVSQLDVRLGREIIQLLSRMAQEQGNTLLVNLHTLELLEGHFERVIALKEGSVFWEGKPDALDEPLLKALYGKEYTGLYAH